MTAFEIVLTILIPIISALAVFILIKLFGKDKVSNWVSIAVWAAEKVFGDGNGKSKYEWVVDKLSKIGINVSNSDKIELVINKAILEMDKTLGRIESTEKSTKTADDTKTILNESVEEDNTL